MTSKDRMVRILSGERVEAAPVVFHSWGDYKVEFAGFHPKFQNYQGGEELAQVERTFYERFKADWIHCGSAGGHWHWNRPRKVEGGRACLRSEDGRRWIEILENYSLANDDAVPAAPYTGPRQTLESKAAIDDYFAADPTTVESILESGLFDHVKRLADEYGDSVFIAVNDGMNGLPWLSFEDAIRKMKQFDIAPFALPNSPVGELKFEESRDVESVEVVFTGTAPRTAKLQYMRKYWPGIAHSMRRGGMWN